MLVIRKLIWDNWNIKHIARHDVTSKEVDEICKISPLVQEGYKGRLVVSGKTAKGRFLLAILEPETEPGIYYVVTAYPASGKYRRIYEEEKKGD